MGCWVGWLLGRWGFEISRQEDEAEEMLQAALSQEPNSPEALLLMGQLLLRASEGGEEKKRGEASSDFFVFGPEPRYMFAKGC